MAQPPVADVTVAVVPRERFSETRRSLERLLEQTPASVPIVYVDGGSPRRIKHYLQARVEDGRISLIRSERWLTPNEARNVALQSVRTRYVVFVDNDLLVTPGWLDALVRCAEDTGAWVVGPVYCIGEPEGEYVHMAGGSAEIETANGRRRFREAHTFAQKRLADVRGDLRQGPCGLVEFHCMLVRTAVFERLGPFDPALLTSREHIDFCLLVRQAGGTVYLEPTSVVTYLSPPPLALSDVPYYLQRWSEARHHATIRHFCTKWDIEEDAVLYGIAGRRRRRLLRPLLSTLRRTVGEGLFESIERRLVIPVEQTLNRWVFPEKRRRPLERASH
jgi:GT2 family glycosyltransferase